MLEISFIYKTNCDENINYGKIKLGYVSYDTNGLDIEIKRVVWDWLSYGLIQEDKILIDLEIGVIGVLADNQWTAHFTHNNYEKNIFKVYIYEEKDKTYGFYNGKEITCNTKELYKINSFPYKYRWDWDYSDSEMEDNDIELYVSSDDEDSKDTSLNEDCKSERINVTPVTDIDIDC
jgi:hypothetical protein